MRGVVVAVGGLVPADTRTGGSEAGRRPGRGRVRKQRRRPLLLKTFLHRRLLQQQLLVWGPGEDGGAGGG